MADERRERADRILDAAADLLVRWGQPRVTIGEVAKRAGVGKGTVYLHWRSREELFLAVLTREGAVITDELAENIRANPMELLPHRYLRAVFLDTLRRPLTRAVYTNDAEVLGKIASGTTGERLSKTKLANASEYMSLLREQGLLRTDLTSTQFNYAAGATMLGFLLIDPMLPSELSLPDEEKADLLAATIRSTFEPAEPPKREVVEMLAPKLAEMFTELARKYRVHTYSTGE
jgi:AcrR family transcriptional regulator